MATPVQSSRCPRCGAEKLAGAPCPHCLLQLGLSLPPRDADAASGASSGAPEPGELARHFPGLEILELVARGGMGAVYRARHRKLERLVALKILAPELSGDPAFAERFLREARAMARLDHPNIVAVHDFGESEGLCWLLMEYVEGVNLRQAMANGGLTPAQALAIVPQLCDALQAAHDLGVVHRDIKPENVLLDRAGKVKIADFGLAKLAGRAALEPNLTRTDAAMGTLHYMAPEQMLGAHAVDHRADIFSLGVVFYEMLTGRLPLGSFEPPSRRVEVDVRLDEIVLRTLAQEPERRYQQALEVKTDVQAVGTPAKSVRAEPAPTPATAEPRRPAPAKRASSADRWRRWLIDGPGRLLIWLVSFPLAVRAFSRFEEVGLVLVVLLYTLWLFLETRIHAGRDAALAALCARWSRRERTLRFAGFLLVAAAGLTVVGAAVESTWELGTDHYVSPTARARARAEPWNEDHGYALLQRLDSFAARTSPPELGAPEVERYYRRHLPNAVLTFVLGALLLVAAGALLGSARGRTAWRAVLAPAGGAALLILFAFVLIQVQQMTLPGTLDGLGGTLRIRADVARVRAELSRALEAEGHERVLEIGETLVEKRAREPLARHELLAVLPASLFERWEFQRGGPRRARPGLVFELVGELDGSLTVLSWDAGLLRDGEREGPAWRDEVEALLAGVAREAERP